MTLAAKTATSIFVKPLALMAQLVASSATFQDIVDAATEAEALNFVHYPLASDQRDSETGQMVSPRPRAIIDWGDSYDWSNVGTGEWRCNGSVLISFEFPVLAEDDGSFKDEAIEFGEKVGSILSEMAVNVESGSGTYANARAFTLVQPPATLVDGEDVFMGVTFAARWVG